MPSLGDVPNQGLTDTTDLQSAQLPDQGTAEREPVAATGAEELETPLDRRLPDGEVYLQAESASIVVRWDAESGRSRVTARWSLAGTQGTVFVSSRSNSSTISYAVDPTVEGYPIFELHLSPGQSASVVGRSLSVDAADVPHENQPSPDEGEDQPPPSSLEIAVAGSDVTLMNIPVLQVSGEDNVVYSSGGSGLWTFDLHNGSSEFVDHSGSLLFTGRRTEAKFAGILGALSIDLTESKGFVVGGGGNVKATTSGGSIEFDEIAGNLTVTGISTLVAIRRVRTNTLVLTGDDLYATIEDGQGRARVALNGGDFTASRWKTRIDLSARFGARATVDELEGDIAFNAEDGASLRVSGVSGHVRGSTKGSTFEGSLLKSIQLDGTDSDITVESTLHLTKLDLVDSTARLNLYELRGTPEISLKGASRADIDLHYPCQVRVQGPGAQNPGRITVDGCENLRPEQRWSQPRRQRRGDKPMEPIHLTVFMDDRADVNIRGY